jgi:glutathione S-transferase
MATDLLLYGLKGSPFMRKVQVLLAEKGVDYEIEMLSPFPQPPDWYAAVNPAKRIPMLRDRSIGTEGAAGAIPDSSAICAYIERKHPEPALYPAAAFDLGRALWLEEYADSEFAGRVGIGIFRPMIFPKMQGKDSDVETARKTLETQLPPIFDYFEAQLGEGEYLVGDAFSIADISVATQFGNLQLAGGSVDSGRWPRLAGYVQRLLGRPSFAECLESERKVLPPIEAL